LKGRAFAARFAPFAQPSSVVCLLFACSIADVIAQEFADDLRIPLEKFTAIATALKQ